MDDIWELIKRDLHRVVPGKISFWKLIRGFRSKGFRYLFFLRFAGSSVFVVRLIARLVVRFLTLRYGFQIPHNAVIGPGLYIGHFGTVVISSSATIGANCNLAHNVTIGMARGRRLGAPRIGDRVWIGTGAVLVGKIVIGTDVVIAPNAFVNFDVPDNSLVIGNPGAIIPKERPTVDYINNVLE